MTKQKTIAVLEFWIIYCKKTSVIFQFAAVGITIWQIIEEVREYRRSSKSHEVSCTTRTIHYMGHTMQKRVYKHMRTSRPRSGFAFMQSGPEVIKLFSCSTQLSMKSVLLINHKLIIIKNSFLLNIAEHENFSANKYENANYCWHFHIY